MPRRSRRLLTSLARATRYHLIVPLLRSRHAPEHTARGVAAGVFWGVLPILGLQSVGIFLTWTLARRTRWDLSLVQALAWQWVNNPLTMVPLYYLFYTTGHILIGHGWAGGYQAFLVLWIDTTRESATWFDRAVSIAQVLGVPTLIGALPWAVLGGGIGYRFTRRFLTKVPHGGSHEGSHEGSARGFTAVRNVPVNPSSWCRPIENSWPGSLPSNCVTRRSHFSTRQLPDRIANSSISCEILPRRQHGISRRASDASSRGTSRDSSSSPGHRSTKPTPTCAISRHGGDTRRPVEN